MGKQTQEAADLGIGLHRSESVGVVRGYQPLACVPFALLPPVGKHGRRSLKTECKAAKFDMRDLMRCNHLEPGEIVLRLGIARHHWREKDLGAIRRSSIFIYPANVLLHQALRIKYLKGRAGKGAAVELEDPFDLGQFQP